MKEVVSRQCRSDDLNRDRTNRLCVHCVALVTQHKSLWLTEVYEHRFLTVHHQRIQFISCCLNRKTSTGLVYFLCKTYVLDAVAKCYYPWCRKQQKDPTSQVLLHYSDLEIEVCHSEM